MARRPGTIPVRGDLLRHARETQGATRDALAAMLGATPDEYETMGKAISRMEKTGKASRPFVERVCGALCIPLSSVRLDGFVRLNAPRGFDLRPWMPPSKEEPADWLDSRTMITISELSLSTGDTPCAIRNFRIDCALFPRTPFAWLYTVSLNPSATTWCGDPKDISRLELGPGEHWAGEVMCAAVGGGSEGASWRETLARLRSATDDVGMTLILENDLGERIERRHALSIAGLEGNEKASKKAGYPEPPVIQLYEAGWKRV